MTAIEIYTRPGCGYCTAAKSLLTRKNAAFTELNVASDPAYRDRASVPVIIYTAHPDSMSRERARQLGATDYLVKGGDLLPLLTTLVRHLNPAAATAAVSDPVSSRI